MLIISTPRHFGEGDTIPVKINGNPATLTWRDRNILVVNETDARPILEVMEESDCLTFTCGNAAGEPQLPIYVSRPKEAE